MSEFEDATQNIRRAAAHLRRDPLAVPLETMIEEMTAGERQVRVATLGGTHLANVYAMGGILELSTTGESVRAAIEALYAAWRERSA